LMRKRDYYAVLGVSRGVSLPELRRAYRRLARQYSPDVNFSDERSLALFAEIDEAYRVLGDVGARTLYDRLGHRAFAPEGAANGDGPGRGEDLHYAIEIEFEDSLRGLRVVLDVARLEPCATCSATGGAHGRQVELCAVCEGRPVRILEGPGRPVASRCQACRGTGWQLPERCLACGGRGTVPGTGRIPVRIPPGVDTGAQIRVPGEGHAGPAPAGRGDLVVVTRVRPHAFFTRKGDHLCCEVPVTVPEAALGARIQLPTPEGPVVVTVPAGTQSGQVLRIRGRGCPRRDRGGRGDLLVATRVVIPRNADSTLAGVLRELQRLWPENPRAAMWSGRGAR
jgi:molecular chaperone DnaJ